MAREESRGRTYRERIAAAVHHFLASPHDPPHSDTDTIGDDSMPPQELHLPDEWVDELDVVHDGERYSFVVENGELGLERSENE